MDINSLISKVDVLRIIERTVPMQQSGRRYYKGVYHDSLVVDLSKNKFYWNSIEISGDALTWLTKIEGLSYRDSLKILQEYSGLPFTRVFEVLEEPVPIYPKLLDAFYLLGKSYRDYWYSRGYTDEAIDHFQLGFTGTCYVIPIIYEGVLKNFQCRVGSGDNKRIWWWARHQSTALFNMEVTKTGNYILTEGSSDAIIMWQLGYFAASQNNINFWDSAWNKHLFNLSEVYVVYDNDVAGRSASRKLVPKLLNRGRLAAWPEFLPDKYDINKAYLDLGESKTRKLLDSMIEHSISAELIGTPMETKERQRMISETKGIFSSG